AGSLAPPRVYTHTPGRAGYTTLHTSSSANRFLNSTLSPGRSNVTAAASAAAAVVMVVLVGFHPRQWRVLLVAARRRPHTASPPVQAVQPARSQPRRHRMPHARLKRSP
ncbi:hypothetical protein DQ04_27661000, partial [Trypanosoma grayi]|uniref:hypothetical protein n=1 Tax=Trypanosoma grayi TaxID=71804 RepID=UPI0004F48B6D